MAQLLLSAGRRNLKGYLVVLSGLLMVADLYLIFVVAPTDLATGNVQRVFYFHVPIAFISFLAFFLVFLASVTYLVGRDAKWDRWAHASAEVGVVFVTLALLTGIIWARPVNNTWWTWEPRFTTTLILWFIYVAYLMIRAYAPNRAKAAAYSAVVGIVGFVDVPIVYFSVVWWRSIHQPHVLGPLAAENALEPIMLVIWLFSQATFLALFVVLLLERVALRNNEDQLGGIRLRLRRSGR